MQSKLLDFGSEFGLEKLNRGRRPNAGIYGNIDNFKISVQIESVETDWNVLPDELYPDMEFTIWCGISKLSGNEKKEMLCCTKYSNLEQELDVFLSNVVDLVNEFKNGQINCEKT